MNDIMIQYKNELKKDIDWILKGKEINYKNLVKAKVIMLPKTTVMSHRIFKFGKENSGIFGHSTRKTVRSELGVFLNEYIQELFKLSKKLRR